MEPVDIKRAWHRARFDERGVWIDRKPPIPWEDIKAFGVDIRSMPWLASLGAIIGLARGRCLHICAVGHEYAVPVPAVAIAPRWPQPPDYESDTRALRAQVGEWLDRVPVVCPPLELSFWWVANGGYFPRLGPPPVEHVEPSTHERAEKIQHDLDGLKDQLGRIENRKNHGHPPA